ncbi:Small nuclear ribonucleoprotein Sm D2 [Euphorbia peplus]|nr:Small nuclear ribonucleoprotein Sm D2 [Euphorbia peplus]
MLVLPVKYESEDISMGPLSILMESVKNNTQDEREPKISQMSFIIDLFGLSTLMLADENCELVLISCRNNKKLFGCVRAFDRHFNMVLEIVLEMWSEVPKTGKGKEKAEPVNKERFISKMFLEETLLSSSLGILFRSEICYRLTSLENVFTVSHEFYLSIAKSNCLSH